MHEDNVEQTTEQPLSEVAHSPHQQHFAELPLPEHLRGQQVAHPDRRPSALLTDLALTRRPIRSHHDGGVQNTPNKATTDYRGSDCTLSLTLSSPGLATRCGMIVVSFLQAGSRRWAIGCALAYQHDAFVHVSLLKKCK
ncbi:uncharacterized protein LOC117191093 [Drosophila miranda]|uniref:uncharacterized protein LOC117191093 n=1 Tax=Drosophila miranda TaxID=7229 RepID=UPI00143F9701|nr:uncharacterized protein LOC117191093 [Drosophila miranda]